MVAQGVMVKREVRGVVVKVVMVVMGVVMVVKVIVAQHCAGLFLMGS